MCGEPNSRGPGGVGLWLRWFVWCGVTVSTAVGTSGRLAAQGPQVLPPARSAPAVLVDDPKVDTPLPPPKPLDPPPPWINQPPRNAQGDRVLGTTPKVTAKTAEKIKQYFDTFIEPEANLTLIAGQSRLLILKETPKRIQVANESVVEYNFLGKDQMLLLGRSVGTTIMTFWFPDPKDAQKEEILTFYVRTLPDPEERERLERSYKTLQDQVNCAFPDSVICLHLVGDKLVVTGQAKDIAEVSKIMQIISSNAQNPGGTGGRRGGGGGGGTGGSGSGRNRLPTDRSIPDRNPNDPTETPGQPIVPGNDNYLTEGSGFIVNMIRIPGEQTVALHVTIAEVNRGATRSIGMNFAFLNKGGEAVFAQNTGAIATGGLARTSSGFGVSGALAGGGGFIPSTPGVPAGSGGFNNLPVSLDNGQVRLAISALRDLNYAKLLAEPTLKTINGEEATFDSGGQFPLPIVSQSSNGGSLVGVQFQPYGVHVTFTPYITDRDRIRLVLDANITAISQSVGTTNIQGSQIPNFNRRHVNTTVEMRDGQTLAVAGLIQNDWTADAHRVPFFGDLPIVGHMFSFDRVGAGEQELIMLVTPELVHPIDCKMRLPLPGADYFEPTDVEFYLYSRLESHGQKDYRSPTMTDWQRIRNFQQMESTYISGPSGYSPPATATPNRASVIGP